MSKKISSSLFHDPRRSPFDYKVDPFFNSSMNSNPYPEYHINRDFFVIFISLIVMCSWVGRFTLTVARSTQVYQWQPLKYGTTLQNAGSTPVMEEHPIRGRLSSQTPYRFVQHKPEINAASSIPKTLGLERLFIKSPPSFVLY